MAEGDDAGLLIVQFQVELLESLPQFIEELFSVGFMLEADHEVVGIADDHTIARGMPPPSPLIGPQVQRVVQIDVGQQGRDTSALRDAFVQLDAMSCFHHARVQPLAQLTPEMTVRDAVLDELHQTSVIQRVEEGSDVGVEHEVHLLRLDGHRQSIQRQVRALARAKAVGEALEVGFVYRAQHCRRRALDDLVLQRGDADGTPLAAGLGDVDPFDRRGVVTSLGQTIREVLEITLQLLPVIAPRLTVDAGRGLLRQLEVSLTQAVDGVDVVEEVGEPQLLILESCLSYPIQRRWTAGLGHGPRR